MPENVASDLRGAMLMTLRYQLLNDLFKVKAAEEQLPLCFPAPNAIIVNLF
jgi:hypothetical protein